MLMKKISEGKSSTYLLRLPPRNPIQPIPLRNLRQPRTIPHRIHRLLRESLQSIQRSMRIRPPPKLIPSRQPTCINRPIARLRRMYERLRNLQIDDPPPQVC